MSFRHSSLRTRLVLLALLSFVPMLGILGYWAYADYRREISAIEVDATRTARLIAANQERTMEGGRQLLIALAQSPQVLGQDAAACSTLLANLIGRYPAYANLAATDRAGNVFCSAVPLSQPVNQADRTWYQDAVQTRDFAVGQYQVGRVTGKPAFNLAYPIIDDASNVRGVVYLAMDLSWMNNLAASAELPTGSTLTVVDRQGTIVARYPNGDQWIGKTMPEEPLVRAALSGANSTMDLSGLDGIPRLHAFADVKSGSSQSLHVSVGIPKESAFRPVSLILVRTVVSLALIALLALLVVWAGVNTWIVQGVARLLQATDRLAGGDLNTRVELPRAASELEHLGSAFNRMAAGLQDTLDTLRKTEGQLRAVINTTTDLVCFKDAEGRWLEANDAQVRLFGLEAIDFRGKTDLELAELAPARREAFLAYVAADDGVWAGGAPKSVRQVIGTAAGPRLIETRRKPLFHSDGSREGLVILGRDVTEEDKGRRLQSALYRIAEIAASAENMPAFYVALHETVNELMDARNFYIALYDEATRRISFPYFVDDYDPVPASEELDHSLTAWIIRNGQTLFVRQEEFAEILRPGEIEMIGTPSVDWIGVPLVSEGRTIGVLAVMSYSEKQRFGEREKELLTFVSQHIAWAFERRRAQEALRDSEERYRTLVQNLPIGVYRNTPGAVGSFVMVNPALLAMFSAGSPEEFARRSVASVYADPAERKRFSDRLIAAGSLTGVELQFRRLDGSLLWGLVTARVVRDPVTGEVAYFDCSMEDITERKRVEAAEHRQGLLADALRYASAALASTLDYEEVLDRILSEVGRVLEHEAATILLIKDDVTQVARRHVFMTREPGIPDDMFQMKVSETPNLRAMFQSGRSLVIPDARDYAGWRDLPGMTWVRAVVGAPIRAKGEVIGFIQLASCQPCFYSAQDGELLQAFADQAGVAIENARLYEELHRRADELEARVAERTAELSRREATLSETAERLQAANAALQQAAARLQELNQLKSQFLANVSHELRTPLANIKLYLSLLERGKPEKREQYMATLERETSLLHHLIAQILDLSHLELGKSQALPSPVDLNQVVSALVADRAALAAERGLSLDLQIQPDLPSALADQNGLRQVLANLVTNAMNYTQAGGSIVVRTGLGTTCLPVPGEGETADCEPGYLVLSVTDTGHGIAPDEVGHLFERFYRGRAAQEGNVPGTGLGLAICHEIIGRYGGHITVDSQLGGGSTFYVWLPRADVGLAQPANGK